MVVEFSGVCPRLTKQDDRAIGDTVTVHVSFLVKNVKPFGRSKLAPSQVPLTHATSQGAAKETGDT